jgi:hypothetical protein
MANPDGYVIDLRPSLPVWLGTNGPQSKIENKSTASATVWESVAAVCAVLVLVALSIGPMTRALPSSTVVPAERPLAAAATPSKTIPAGLQQAIHRTVGPGPIGLGTAPLVSGIARSSSGWAASAPNQGVSATIATTGSVHVSVRHTGLVGHLTPRSLGVGTDSTMSPLRVLSSTLVGGRLDQNMGPLSTSYQVNSAGLEQSFTIGKASNRTNGPVAVDLGPAAGWTVHGHGTSLIERGPKNSASLAYGGLKTTDARGAVVPSRLAIIHGSVEIVAHPARTTAYPITIDPTWTTSSSPTATLTDSGSPPVQEVGFSVAISADGTTALVGGNQVGSFPGVVHIFRVSSEGSWASSSSPTATLSNSGGAPNDDFGNSVAISGDGTTALIGAPGVGSFTGAAYLFHVPSEGSWASSSSPTSTLTSPSGAASDVFANSVGMSADGTTALIGAPGVGSFTGAAYVFHVSSGGSWPTSSAPTATLTNSGGLPQDAGGVAVAISADGTTALIGASGVNTSMGAGYIFHVPSEGSWVSSSSPTATLTNAGGVPQDVLGFSVAMSADGTSVLLGAVSVSSHTGAAYVFHVLNEGSWASSSSPTATLTNSDGLPGDNFGYSVALSPDGTIALVGAYGANSNSGAVYLFQVSGESSWASSSSPAATLTDAGGSSNAVGYSEAMSADETTALLGAPNVGFSSGAAFVYRTSAAPPTVTGVSPNVGATTGGTSITIEGSGFTGATAADIGPNNACTSSFVVVSDTMITCDAPTGSAGTVDVTVTTPQGTSSPNPPNDEFTYVTSSEAGYREIGADGDVSGFGGAQSFGSMAGAHLNKPVVGMAATPDGKGYWLVAADGGVFSFGDAHYYGSMGATHLNQPIVGMATTPDDKGYWLVAADGGIFSFGDAQFSGSTGGAHLNKPVVGMATTLDGKGYWLVAADGGVFSFGDAQFSGSMGAAHLNQPIVGMATSPDDKGYWLVAADGGIFSFGDAQFSGSTGGAHLNKPVVGMATTLDGKGYWLVAADGGVFCFGDAQFSGSMGGSHLSEPVVGIAAG